MLRTRLVTALTVLLCLAAPSAASAATVDTRLGERPTGLAWEVVVAAAPGERNDVTVSTVDLLTIRVSDAGAPIAPGERCRSLAANTVECDITGTTSRPGVSPYLYTARVVAGDGDDVVRSTGASGPLLVADGGAGDDLLVGSVQKADDLDGGGGTDTLLGRGNADTLTDGDLTGAAGPDTLDGGADRDTVSYAGRTAPVTLALGSPGTAGEAGEGDMVTGVESAVGGSGADEIDGTPAPNRLEGGAGADHLDGHGGPDSLLGGGGRDVLHGHAGGDGLDGGTGADRLRGDAGDDVAARPSRGDIVSCGTGRDAIGQAATGVRVRRSCESLTYAFDAGTGALTDDEGTNVQAAPFPVATSPRTLTFAIGCPRPALMDGLCSFDARQTIILRSPAGRRLGSGRLDGERYRRLAAAERGDVNRIDVRLNSAGRRLFGRRGGLLTSVSLRTDDLAPAGWRARLRVR